MGTAKDNQPNDKLLAAREAMKSRVVPGAKMSPDELAGLVNTYVWEASHHKIRTDMDGHTVRRYERGDVRWPRAVYRAGLRAVLMVSTDADLGFWPTSRGRTAAADKSTEHAKDEYRPEADPTAANFEQGDHNPRVLKADLPTARVNYAEIDLATACDWLDDYVGWMPKTSRRRVASRLASFKVSDTLDQHSRRAKVTRAQIAQTLLRYYAVPVDGHGIYRGKCGEHEILTSILTRPDWLSLACSLTPDNDTLSLVPAPDAGNISSSNFDAAHAVNRLAEAAALDARLANVPLYRLLAIDAKQGEIAGTVGLASFIEYALTADLLETELSDAIIAERTVSSGKFQLREKYLPSIASALDFSARLCAGGALALCAIARPADAYRDRPDYALLIQERSGYVLNATRRLAVIPKGFHQPLSDYRHDARIGATLRRELEEELFGRSDVDSTGRESRVAAPMHPTRLSEPMQWLMGEPDRMRIECTGFGLNLVSGNYEFASLIVIEDDEFWTRYGGQVEANWESAGLRVYSSLDCQLIAELILDESWSNEGLFAFLQGLARLGQIDESRVNLPLTSWDLIHGS